MGNKIVFLSKNGFAYLKSTEDDGVIKICQPYLDALETIMEGFNTARTETTSGYPPPYSEFIQGKVNILRTKTAEKITPLVEKLIVLASEQSNVVSNMQANAFFRSNGTNVILDEMRMREVRDVLRNKSTAEQHKYFTGSDLFIATAILKSPIPFFPENPDMMKQAIEQRMGKDSVDYRNNMSDAITTIKAWLIRAYQLIGLVPDNRIESIKL
jgi:hypothetical protein